MDYFDKQDPRSGSHEDRGQAARQPFPVSKHVFPDNWKVPQDGDFDFVSTLPCSGALPPALSLSGCEFGCV